MEDYPGNTGGKNAKSENLTLVFEPQASPTVAIGSATVLHPP